MVLPVAASPTPDLCVVGGGTAGHAVALAAAALGATCTLVDPGTRLGAGQAADLADAMLIAAAHARAAAGPQAPPFDQTAFARRLGRALADLAPNHAAERLRMVGVQVVCAEAHFADPRTVVANGTPIRARRMLVATGTVPRTPNWAATLEARMRLRSSDLGTMAARPQRLAVVADGPGGLDVAQAARRLGSEVTLILASRAVAVIDPELLAPVLAALRHDGVVLHLDSHVAEAEPGAGAARLRIDGAGPDGAISSVWSEPMSHVLILAGRVPATATLGLDRAGIIQHRGAPVVDAAFRTSNGRVFAIGDVLGQALPGGAAIPQQIGIVLRASLFRQPVRRRPIAVPLALRTDPPLAQVGDMSAPHAGGAKPSERRVVRWPLAETTLGLMGHRGLVKVVATERGTVAGAGLVGPGALDAITTWTVAIGRDVPLQSIAGLPVPSASLAEASRRAALGFVTVRLRSPWIRRLLAVLRRLG